MKILLLKFPDKQNEFIKEIINKTTFKKATIIERIIAKEAEKSNILEDLGLILFFGNPQDPTLKDVCDTIPLIYIVEEEYEIDAYPGTFSNRLNYLPINEVTSFALEKCIFNTLEKTEIKKKLHSLELLQNEIVTKEQKFKDLFNNSSVGMYEIDPKGKFVMANNVFMQMLGLNDFDELNNFNAFKHGFSINGSREKLKKLLETTGEIKDFEDIWISADKSNIVVNEHIKVKNDKNGEVEYYQGVVENITKRKEVEKQLKISGKVFENSIDMLCIAGYDGYFKTLNPAWTRTLGWSMEELLSKPWIEFVHPNDRLETTKVKPIFKEGRKIFQYENRYICKDGQSKWLSWNSFPYRDERIVFGVARDITEKKKQESELIKSKKNAEKADRLKSEFLTQISHEIRTPVNTLLSFASLIKNDLNGQISEDLVSSFNYIDNAGKRLTRTIDLLIKISELQTDNYEPEYLENDLIEILEEILPNHKKDALAKNITLHLIIRTNESKIIVDKFTITDVLNNLIDNAVKFTQKGSVKVIVEKTISNKVSLSVQDSGIGISEQYITNIFSPFSQESGGYSRKFDGNGLGLSLVKEYCNLNNAEIFVNSEKNAGSTFTVIFK